MRPRSRPSWTYPLFTDTFKLQKRSVDFSGKQPPLERQVQPKKAPSESRIYPRDFDTFARGDEEMYIVETLAKNRRLYPGEGKGCKTIGRELKRSKASVKKRIRGKETSQRYKRRQAVDPVLEADRGWLLSTLEADRKAPVSYRQ